MAPDCNFINKDIDIFLKSQRIYFIIWVSGRQDGGGQDWDNLTGNGQILLDADYVKDSIIDNELEDISAIDGSGDKL